MAGGGGLTRGGVEEEAEAVAVATTLHGAHRRRGGAKIQGGGACRGAELRQESGAEVVGGSGNWKKQNTNLLRDDYYSQQDRNQCQ